MSAFNIWTQMVLVHVGVASFYTIMIVLLDLSYINEALTCGSD